MLFKSLAAAGATAAAISVAFAVPAQAHEQERGCRGHSCSRSFHHDSFRHCRHRSHSSWFHIHESSFFSFHRFSPFGFGRGGFGGFGRGGFGGGGFGGGGFGGGGFGGGGFGGGGFGGGGFGNRNFEHFSSHEHLNFSFHEFNRERSCSSCHVEREFHEPEAVSAPTSVVRTSQIRFIPSGGVRTGFGGAEDSVSLPLAIGGLSLLTGGLGLGGLAVARRR